MYSSLPSLSSSSSRLESSNLNKNENCIPIAIALICLVGGFFLLLASYQILPSSPNLISRLGWWGEAAGFIVLGIGGLLFIGLRQEEKNAPIHDEVRETLRLGHKVLEASEQLKHERKLREKERARQKQLEKEKELRIGEESPKRLDGKAFKLDDIVDAHQRVREIYQEVSKISSLVLWLSAPKIFASSLKGQTRESLKSKLSACIHNFQHLYNNNRYSITADSNSDLLPETVEANMIAERLNYQIDQLKDSLAKQLATIYKDPNSPPEVFTDSSNEAIIELKRCWESCLATSVKRETPKATVKNKKDKSSHATEQFPLNDLLTGLGIEETETELGECLKPRLVQRGLGVEPKKTSRSSVREKQGDTFSQPSVSQTKKSSEVERIEAYCQKGKPEKASKELKKIYLLGSDKKKSLQIKIVEAYCKKGEPKNASKELKKIFLLGFDKKKSLQIQIVETYCRIGDPEKASKELKKIFLLDSDKKKSLQIKIVEAYCKKGEPKNASKELKKIFLLGSDKKKSLQIKIIEVYHKQENKPHILKVIEAMIKDFLLEEMINRGKWEIYLNIIVKALSERALQTFFNRLAQACYIQIKQDLNRSDTQAILKKIKDKATHSDTIQTFLSFDSGVTHNVSQEIKRTLHPSYDQFFDTLGLEPSASKRQVKKAYFALAKIYHPDRQGNAEKFKEISEAYTILSDQLQD